MPTSQEELNALLRQGIELARAGQQAEARAVFEQVIEADEYNEVAWMWMASVITNNPQRREALEIVLEINPDNERAREALARLGGPRAQQLAQQASWMADRIGGEEIDEREFQRAIEHALEEPEAEDTRSDAQKQADAQRRMAEQAIQAARQQQEAASEDESEDMPGDAHEAPQVDATPYYDFAGERRGRFLRRLGSWAGYGALILVGAGLVAVIIFGIGQLLQTPPPPSATPVLATVMAQLTPTASASPTESGFVIVTIRPENRTPSLAPTWTPSPTLPPSATPRPTATMPPPGDYALIFSSNRPGEANARLYTIRGDGTEEDRLTTNNDEALNPAPTAEGQRIAFVLSYEGGHALAVLDRSPLPTFTPSGPATRTPSPAETESATEESTPESEATEEETLEVAATATPTPQARIDLRVIIRLGGRRLSSPSWSPDGTRIAFSSDHDGDEEIYIINLDGSSLAQLTRNEGLIDRDPAWSPDGEAIIFASEQGMGGGQTEIWSIRPDSTGLTRLTNTAGNNFQPAWSPDGESIVFVSDRNRDSDLFIMRADGLGARLLTADDGDAEDRDPVWSPDGRWIAFSSNRDGLNFQVYLIDPAGEQVIRVTQSNGDDSGVGWLDWPPALAGM